MTSRGPFSADYPLKPHTMDVGGAAIHYIDEDFPHEIGEKIASWVEGFD